MKNGLKSKYNRGADDEVGLKAMTAVSAGSYPVDFLPVLGTSTTKYFPGITLGDRVKIESDLESFRKKQLDIGYDSEMDKVYDEFIYPIWYLIFIWIFIADWTLWDGLQSKPI